jgi:hypothetical protein
MADKMPNQKMMYYGTDRLTPIGIANRLIVCLPKGKQQ